MFDVGFFELLLVGLILLLVLGPERLPAVAKKAGQTIRKVKAFTHKISQEITAELDAEEIKKQLSLDDDNDVARTLKAGKKELQSVKKLLEKE